VNGSLARLALRARDGSSLTSAYLALTEIRKRGFLPQRPINGTIGLGLSWVVGHVSGWVPLVGMAGVMVLWTARLAFIELKRRRLSRRRLTGRGAV
jgi:hypothetical protein